MKLIAEKKTYVRGVNAAARALGISRGHLSQVLRGERKPSDALAEKLKTIYGVTLPKPSTK